MTKRFLTSINCIDGRTQKPVIEYLEKNFGTDYVDMITEPGPNRILAEGKDTKTIESLKEKVRISVEKHGSRVISIAGHYDCAGNPETEVVQKEHLKKARDIIASWGFPVDRIIALWLDENFEVSVVS